MLRNTASSPPSKFRARTGVYNMAFSVDKWPVKGLMNSEVIVAGRWLGGGAASDMTKVTGRGIDSVKYNSATGAYIIKFTSVGPTWLGCWMTVLDAGSTSAQKVVNPVVYSASARTLTVFITDAATPTAKDLATTEELQILALWSDSSQA